MENINNVIEKLMLNRTRLMLNRIDKELKEIIDNDLQSFKSLKQSGNKSRSKAA
jgi:hypothetical protein